MTFKTWLFSVIIQKNVVTLPPRVNQDRVVMKHNTFSIVVKTVFLLILVLSGLTGLASNTGIHRKACDTTSRHEVIFDIPEQRPQFPGGEMALMKYLADNCVYPPEAAKDSVQGRVVVQFVIDSMGYVGEVKVLRSVREDIDAEAVRVVKTLPRFAPGRQDGKAINTRYILPVTFKLAPEEGPNQTDDAALTKASDAAKAVGEMLEFPEKMPEFPGGDMALMNFLRRNIRYPSRAAIKKIEGRVVVQFIVDEKGKVGEIKVAESVDKDLDNEAIRICKTLPKFSPALLHGEPVKVWYTLPITFKIPRDPNRDF